MREIAPGFAVRSPEIHYLGNRYWLTLSVEGGGTQLIAFDSTDLHSAKFARASITEKGAGDSHYLNGAYYIAWCVNLMLGMGLLKCTTGRPEGPYVPTYEGNRALISPNIDASLFTGDDGTPYFVWQGRYVRKMSRDLSGFARERVELLVEVPHAGHSTLFQDCGNRWHLAFFGNDRTAPFRAMPGIVPRAITDTGTDLPIQPMLR